MTRSALAMALLAGCPHAPPPGGPGATGTTGASAPSSAGTAGNRAACLAYIGTFNAAPCSPVDLDADQVCPDSLDALPCDLAGYYGCMAEAVRCAGDYLDISGQAQCPPPTCPGR